MSTFQDNDNQSPDSKKSSQKPVNADKPTDIKEKPKQNIGKYILRIIILTAFLWILLFLVKTPYMFEAPGLAVDISKLIHVHDVISVTTPGKFYLTTVLYERAGIFLYLWGKLDKDVNLTPYQESEEHPSPKFRDEHMKRQMETSKTVAQVAAFRALGYMVPVTRSPLEIVAILKGSKAEGILQTGDIITSFNDIPIRKDTDLALQTRKHHSKNHPRLSIIRNGKNMTLEVPLTIFRGEQKFMILVNSRITNAEIPFRVDIQSKNIIGASAGLMFTLEIIRQATGIDITGGKKIAGTGAIDEDGKVLPIKGAKFKVISAEREGAVCFLVPRENYEEAQSGAHNIKVYPVDTLAEALDVLKKLNPSASIEEYRKRIKKENGTEKTTVTTKN